MKTHSGLGMKTPPESTTEITSLKSGHTTSKEKKWAFDNITLVKTRAYFHPNSSPSFHICNRCQKKNGAIVQRLNFKPGKKETKNRKDAASHVNHALDQLILFFLNYDRRAIQGIRITENTLVIQSKVDKRGPKKKTN